MSDERDEWSDRPSPFGDERAAQEPTETSLPVFVDEPDEPDAPAPAASPLPRRRLSKLASCLVVLVVVGGLVAGGVVLLFNGAERLRDQFQGAEDYEGAGTGSVLVEVTKGDTSAVIGRKLKRAGVVASVDAFTEAAAENPDSRGIQVGFYDLRKKMSSESALEVLVDPENLVQSSVTVPEGLRVEDTVALLAKRTDIPVGRFEAALDRPDDLGLPGYAQGNAEGYLYPATYTFPPGTTAVEVLSAMVDRWQQAAEEAGLGRRAQELGYSPEEVMIVASLVEAEVNRQQDRGKVARVIYNRLETDATNGLLQIDATVNYALGRDLGLGLTTEDLEVDSPYNTRKYPGLPPGPIESPGAEAIQAAANPTPGDWVYYVTVDLDSGETKFARDYDDFLTYKRELEQWCTGSDRC